MDIKLRARLSAYSRVDQITPSQGAPDNNSTCGRVTADEIDTLFKQNDTTTNKPSGGTSAGVVSYSQIDSLFK